MADAKTWRHVPLADPALDSEQSTNIMLTIRISNKIGSSAESVGRSARIYHGGTACPSSARETQASPKRFAEASTEKRLSRCAKRDRDNDLLLEQDESQFIMIEDLHITSVAIKSPLVLPPCLRGEFVFHSEASE